MLSAFKEKLIKDLAEFKKLKATGARAMNRAVAQDASYVLKCLVTEVREFTHYFQSSLLISESYSD
jgi:hypothetical protein